MENASFGLAGVAAGLGGARPGEARMVFGKGSP